IDAPDTENIYSIPLVFEREGLAEEVVRRLGLRNSDADLGQWEQMVWRSEHPDREVELAIVGKYTENGDAYISVAESVRHGAIANGCRVKIRWVESAELTRENAATQLAGAR